MTQDNPSHLSVNMKEPKDRQPSSARRNLRRGFFVALLLGVLSSGFYFAGQSGTSSEVYSNDFDVYYHAASEIRAGRDPYQNSIGDWTPYLYPPLLAECLVPLTMVSVRVAAYLWFLISAASMLGAAWMSADLASANDHGDNAANELISLQDAIALSALIVVMRFSLDTFNLGQVNTIVAALAVAHVYLYARERKALSAVALVLAVSIKLTPALLIIYHLSKLRLKFACACIAIIAGVTVLSFLPFELRGVNAFQIFANRTLKNQQGYNLADSGNQSLRGASGRIAADENDGAGRARSPLEVVTVSIALMLIAAAVFAANRARNEVAGVAPFFCCLVLLSPLSWKAHFVILALPIAFLVSTVFNTGSLAVARRIALSVLVASFVLFNLTSPRIIGLAASEWADAHSLVTLGALLILITSLTLNIAKFGKHPHVC
jgi:hypothetical protein